MGPTSSSCLIHRLFTDAALAGVYIKLDVELVVRLLVLLQARRPPVTPLLKRILISVFHSLEPPRALDFDI